jgi:DNA gyrase/topoisomerase IV subunit A
MRGRTHIEEIRKDREAIIVTEVPYQVNKAVLVERIAELVREKKIEGIADSATKATATACAWSSSSSATPQPTSC